MNSLIHSARAGLWCLLLLGATATAQTFNPTGSSNCGPLDFDATVQFANGPGDYFNVIIDQRNISDHACRFDGTRYGPGPQPDRIPGERVFGYCFDCDRGGPRQVLPFLPPLVIEPGQIARQTMRWRSKPARDTEHCVQLKSLNQPILLAAPSLLKPLCSDIEVSQYALAPSDGTGVAGPSLALSSDRPIYYGYEAPVLRVSAAEALAKRDPQDCPLLYLRERLPNGMTRIEEVRPLAFRGCERNERGSPLGDWGSGFEIRSSGSNPYGEHTFMVSRLLGSADDAELNFASSPVLRIQTVDPASIRRTWGPRVKGIAIDLTLEKDTYRVAEDVPLHVAIANFDAEGNVLSDDPVWDPPVVAVQVLDTYGRALSRSERFDSNVIWTGHGQGARAFRKGEVVPIELKLRGMDWLPNHPGTYTIVVTWATITSAVDRIGIGSTATWQPYAVARATGVIHIVDRVGASQ